MVRQLRAPSPVQARPPVVRAQPLSRVTSWAASTVPSASPTIGGAEGNRAGAAGGVVVDVPVVPAGAVVGGTAVVGGPGGTVTAG
jgi:hypothetical protein